MQLDFLRNLQVLPPREDPSWLYPMKPKTPFKLTPCSQTDSPRDMNSTVATRRIALLSAAALQNYSPA